MTIHEWLTQASQQLQNVSVPIARLDALVLLEDRLGKDRAWLLAHHDELLSEDDKNVLNGLIARRTQHVPLAYLRGKTEFYGREFVVSEAVLEPRPESETMIDLLKELVRSDTAFEGLTGSSALDSSKDTRGNAIRAENLQIWAADVGTGSGAIGISAALEVPGLGVDLLEIDDAAIKIAKINVVQHATANSVIKSDLLANSTQNYDILLCNLPYVPDDFQINTAASHEPKIAIYGGPDGLDLYRKLFQQIENRSDRPLYILIEILPFQKEALLPIAARADYTLQQADDFIHVFLQAS